MGVMARKLPAGRTAGCRAPADDRYSEHHGHWSAGPMHNQTLSGVLDAALGRSATSSDEEVLVYAAAAASLTRLHESGAALR